MDNGIGIVSGAGKVKSNSGIESYQENHGNGSGLYIVSMVIHEHKGSISLTSNMKEQRQNYFKYIQGGTI